MKCFCAYIFFGEMLIRVSVIIQNLTCVTRDKFVVAMRWLSLAHLVLMYITYAFYSENT